jgi:hypothetical protein
VSKALSDKLMAKMAEVNESDISDRRKASRTEELQLKNKASNRNCSSDIIELEIYEEDDPAVRAIKRALNAAEITLDDVYEKVGRGIGWNYYYGLLKRHTTTMKTFEAWAEILDLRTSVRLLPKK